MGISKAQLSALSGVPKSTLSPILAETDPKLPNLTTLIKISRVISVPPSHLIDFLFDWRVGGKGVDHDATFLAPSALSHATVLRQALLEITSGEIIYAPSNLPDFVKSAKIFDIEIEEISDRDLYLDSLNHLDISQVRGTVLINEVVLDGIMHRKGKYSTLQHCETDDVAEKLLRAQNESLAKFYVVDFYSAAISPILLFENDLSLTYVNNGYLVSRDSGYAESFRSKVNELISRNHCATSLDNVIHRYRDATR